MPSPKTKDDQMDSLTLLLDHSQEVPLEACRELVTLLGPVAESGLAAGLTEELVNAISRCNSEAPAVSLIDWWALVTLGASANGRCYQLPAHLPGELAARMEVLRDLHAGIPAAQWLAARRELAGRQQMIASGHSPLDLDWHGASKLPAERDVWAALNDQLRPTVEALLDGRPGAGPDEDHFERVLHATTIQPESRRWKEMEHRFATTREWLEETSALAEKVHVAGPVGEVPLLEEIPALPEADTAGLEEYLLSCLVDDAPLWSSKVVAGRLDDALADLEAPARARLALLLLPWVDSPAGGHDDDLPSIARDLARIRAVKTRTTELAEAGVDTDELEIALLDGQLDDAERLGGSLREQAEDRLLSKEWTRRVKALAGRADREDLPELRARLEHLLTTVDQFVATDDERGLRTEVERAERELEHHVQKERLARLSGAVDRLRTLGEQSARIFDLDRETSSGERVPAARVEEVVGSAEVLRERRLAQVEELRAGVARELDKDGELDSRATVDFRERLNSLAAAQELSAQSDSEVMGVLGSLEQLSVDVSRQRVRRWVAGVDGEAALVEHLVAYCTERIGYREIDLRRLYVALKTKPFVILAGLTGSGKSSIVRLLPESMGAGAATGNFRRIAVRPDWIDQSETLGYINPVSQRFEPGWLADVVRACQTDPDRLHFVLLDEMNLAPVEQYLAEYLSALEEARAGFGDVAIPLYARGASPVNADEWPAELTFPRNLVLVGTVNIDESTRPLSDRVIDRANVLQLGLTWSRQHHGDRGSQVRQPWLVDAANWELLVESDPSDSYHDELVDVARALESVGVGVGLRAHVELERFLSNAENVLPEVDAFDMGVVQRILPKVRGFKRELQPGLERVRTHLATAGARRAVRVLDHWLDPALSDDTFLDGTATQLTMLTEPDA